VPSSSITNSVKSFKTFFCTAHIQLGAQILHEAVEGAWSTFEQGRVEALKRVLADGYRDDARIDIDTLVVNFW
jgi:hypothetical protein